MSQVSLDRSVSPSGDSHPRWQCGAQWHPVFEQLDLASTVERHDWAGEVGSFQAPAPVDQRAKAMGKLL